jgi:hypothetical protein
MNCWWEFLNVVLSRNKNRKANVVNNNETDNTIARTISLREVDKQSRNSTIICTVKRNHCTISIQKIIGTVDVRKAIRGNRSATEIGCSADLTHIHQLMSGQSSLSRYLDQLLLKYLKNIHDNRFHPSGKWFRIYGQWNVYE